MISDRSGQAVAEYVVILALFVSLAGGALFAIYQALGGRLDDMLSALLQ